MLGTTGSRTVWQQCWTLTYMQNSFQVHYKYHVPDCPLTRRPVRPHDFISRWISILSSFSRPYFISASESSNQNWNMVVWVSADHRDNKIVIYAVHTISYNFVYGSASCLRVSRQVGNQRSKLTN